MQTLTLPLNILADLIFSFDTTELPDRPESRIYKSDPYFPKIVPLSIGKLLDERNQLISPRPFHIFHFANHSEIWRYSDWQDSISRRLYLKAVSDSRSAEYAEMKAALAEKQAKYDAVKVIALKWNPALAVKGQEELLAKTVLALMKVNRTLAQQIPGLEEILWKKSSQ